MSKTYTLTVEIADKPKWSSSGKTLLLATINEREIETPHGPARITGSLFVNPEDYTGKALPPNRPTPKVKSEKS